MTLLWGGTWSSSDPAVAAISASAGLVTGVGIGTVSISYTVGGTSVTQFFSVYPSPTAISGPVVYCAGLSGSLTDGAPGGTWSAGTPTVATIGSTTGAIVALSPGTDTITYTLPHGCSITETVTVVPSPALITGPTHICIGTTASLTDAVPGGSWSSSSAAVATIGSASGVVTGIALGTASITYSIGAGCAAINYITVNPMPGSITGAHSICAGTTLPLSNTVSGGTWSSSDLLVATADALTGIITGVSGGVATISYSFGTGCQVTVAVTVNPAPSLSGSLSIPGICSGDIVNYIPASTMPGTVFEWPGVLWPVLAIRPLPAQAT